MRDGLLRDGLLRDEIPRELARCGEHLAVSDRNIADQQKAR
jgi:hypothetical protein